MKADRELHHQYTILLFHLRQERGIYLADIKFRNLTEAEQDKIRAQARHWIKHSKVLAKKRSG